MEIISDVELGVRKINHDINLLIQGQFWYPMECVECVTLLVTKVTSDDVEVMT